MATVSGRCCTHVITPSCRDDLEGGMPGMRRLCAAFVGRLLDLHAQDKGRQPTRWCTPGWNAVPHLRKAVPCAARSCSGPKWIAGSPEPGPDHEGQISAGHRPADGQLLPSTTTGVTLREQPCRARRGGRGVVPMTAPDGAPFPPPPPWWGRPVSTPRSSPPVGRVPQPHLR